MAAGKVSSGLDAGLMVFLQKMGHQLFVKNPETGVFELTVKGSAVCQVLAEGSGRSPEEWEAEAVSVVNNHVALMLAFSGAKAYIP